MNEKYEILAIKLGTFLSLYLSVSFRKLEDNTYVLKNEKMDFEYYTEEQEEEEAKKDFAEAIISFLISGIKENKLFKWLKIWGFEQKLNEKEAFQTALNNTKANNVKAKNDYAVNKESMFLESTLKNITIEQTLFNWELGNL